MPTPTPTQNQKDTRPKTMFGFSKAGSGEKGGEEQSVVVKKVAFRWNKKWDEALLAVVCAPSFPLIFLLSCFSFFSLNLFLSFFLTSHSPIPVEQEVGRSSAGGDVCPFLLLVFVSPSALPLPLSLHPNVASV